MQQTYLQSLMGGGLIGLSAALTSWPERSNNRCQRHHCRRGRSCQLRTLVACPVSRRSAVRTIGVPGIAWCLAAATCRDANRSYAVRRSACGSWNTVGLRVHQWPRRMRPGSIVPARLDCSRSISLHGCAHGLLHAEVWNRMKNLARNLVSLAAGLIFGLGLAISGMLDPTRVRGFLDISGAWDPSLAFVLGGAVTVSAIGYARFP